MIKSDDSRVVIAGTGVELLQDFVNITKGLRQVLADRCGEQKADEIISMCGRFAYAESETEEALYAERICEVMFGKEDTVKS